jgi:hypothetical protein
MQTYDSIKDCLIAALSDNVKTDAIVERDEGLWEVVLGQDVVTVEADLDLRRVAFSIQSLEEIGKISQKNLVLMLQYSLVWRATSGIYFCLTENEQPVLMVYFSADEVDTPVIRSVVFGLLEKFSLWKDILN